MWVQVDNWFTDMSLSINIRQQTQVRIWIGSNDEGKYQANEHYQFETGDVLHDTEIDQKHGWYAKLTNQAYHKDQTNQTGY